MALEEQLQALTDALTENTKRLDAMLSGGKPVAADKPAAKPAAKAAAKPAAKKPAAKKGTTPEDFVARFGAFLKAGDADDREAAKGSVKAIVDYFGAAKVSAIEAKDYDEALGYLSQFEAGETPDFDGGGEEEEEEGGDESLL